ncbi:uncharacterized protein M6B38_184145 [Iris pallida]|uniref:Protein LNK2 n=1 Tax=Iris pallida TaxID=29817 RepID=A0AAX6EKT5_IRIPA|nr:uncharacterized protein M6B38_184145 [Iris pallida]
MMFDWNDQDQVGDTIWGELNEIEDHIVPDAKDSKDNTVLTFGDYKQKHNNDDVGSVSRSNEQTSGVKNEFPGGSLENGSSFNTFEELSAPRLGIIDAWPDLPCLNVELSKGYINGTDHDSLARALSEKVTVACTVQLDCKPELFGNENDDCDWTNIGDFDDLDRIFRNDTIFGHGMVADVDEFLCQSTEVIGSTAQSIPLPDLPESTGRLPDQDCSSDQLVEHSDRKRKPKEAGDSTVDTTHKIIHQSYVTDQLSEKEDRKKKLLKSRKKAEERSKNKALQNLNGPWPQNISQKFPNPVVQHSVKSPLYTIRTPAIGQQRPTNDAESTGHLGRSNWFMFSHYRCPPYPIPGIRVVPYVQAEGKYRTTVAVGREFYPDSLEDSNILNKMPELQSRQSSMTPQEKVEKLKRRQQIQAMLAIKQQQQQFSRQMNATKNMTTKGNSQESKSKDVVTSNMGIEENPLKLPSSDMNILMDYDESQKISALIDDSSLEETIYYQLQDALGKMDIRVRRCIRNGLFRLARSSTERQSTIDRSRTNKSTRDEDDALVSEEKNLEQSRNTSLPDAETYTNPIDRTIAHLLFHRPPEQCIRPVNNEIPQSPISSNHVYKLPHNVDGSIFEGQPESFGEMEVDEPSL